MSRTFWMSQQEFKPVGVLHGYVVGEGNVMRAFLPESAGGATDTRDLALLFKAALPMLNLLKDIAKADDKSIAALAEMGLGVSDASRAIVERTRAVIALAEGRSE